MSYEIKLPRLAATRETAQKLVDDQLPGDLHREEVHVLGRLVSTSTASFADELLRQLGNRNASTIVLLGVPTAFRTDAEAAAQRRNLSVREGSEADLFA